MKLFHIGFVITFLVTAYIGTAEASSSRFYVVSNKADSNTVVGYQKQNDGKYKMIGEFATGGVGTGDLEIPALKKDETHPLANGDDPLISAFGLVSTDNGKYVLNVNPGDASVSLMKVNADGTLTFINKAPSSDRFPISVAASGQMIAAASVGKDNNNGSISLFKITKGKLKAVEGSRRDLKARPSTIAFSSNGKHVVVNELITGKIKIFGLTKGTLTQAPVSQIDSPRDTSDRFQAVPVGFALSSNGSGDMIVMSEARFLTPDFKLRSASGEVAQAHLYSWQTGSVSSYHLTRKGQISLISGDVLTGAAVEGGEIANCWVVLSKDGKTLWAANALSSSISSFRVRDNGSIAIVNDKAFKVPNETLFFSDIATSQNGKELYQLVGNRGEIMIFDILASGDLKHKQTVSGLHSLGAFGLLAN